MNETSDQRARSANRNQTSPAAPNDSVASEDFEREATPAPLARSRSVVGGGAVVDVSAFRLSTVARWSKNWFRALETLKLVIEIIAIPTAGYWAYTRFFQDEAPALERRVELGGELGWSKPTERTCEAYYRVELHNISKHPLTIARARISAWYLEKTPDQMAAASSSPVFYFDPTEQIRGAPVYSRELSNRLIGRYGPDEKANEQFVFVVERVPNRHLFFYTELWAESEFRDPPPTWVEWRHDPVCGPQDEDAKASAARTS